MTTSLWKRLAVAAAPGASTNTTASGSSPFTWKIGASIILATSLQYMRRARVARLAGGEADLVVDDDVHRAAGAEAARLRQLQRLHHHALAGEGGVAVDQHRQHPLAARVAAPLLARAHRALDHRIDDLQVRGIEGERHVHVAAGRAQVGGEAHVVLHVARALSRAGRTCPRTRRTAAPGDLPSTLTSTLRRPRCAMPMTISSTPPRPPCWIRSSSSGISASPPSSEKRFWPTYLRVQVALEALGGRELPEDVALLLRR